MIEKGGSSFTDATVSLPPLFAGGAGRVGDELES